MTQQRARKTRADLLAGAATEIERHGYTASSVVRILDNTACSKGAMYFHFSSKREMADAVLDNAAAVYAAIAERWVTADSIDPLDAIKGLVRDAAEAFAEEVSLRAEARLSVELEFNARRPLAVWSGALFVLARDAVESGRFRNGFTAEKFLRVLDAALAGHRLLAHINPAGDYREIRTGYTESLDLVLAAATPDSARAAASDTALHKAG